MGLPLKAGVVTIGHGNSSTHNQIFMAADAIWGLKGDKLPQAKFDELKTVMERCLKRQYGPCHVEGFGDVLLIAMDPEVLEKSYQKKPCSLDTCMVTNAAFRCSKCRTAMYCSREHQKQDWARHKVECAVKST